MNFVSGSLCGCLGPLHGDPYCACEMNKRGLKSNRVPMTDEEQAHKENDFRNMMKRINESEKSQA